MSESNRDLGDVKVNKLAATLSEQLRAMAKRFKTEDKPHIADMLEGSAGKVDDNSSKAIEPGANGG